MICYVEEDTTFCVFILFLYTWLHEAAFNKFACSRDALQERGYQEITLISLDKQSCIKLLHAEVDVILFATKLLDSKDVTGH